MRVALIGCGACSPRVDSLSSFFCHSCIHHLVDFSPEGRPAFAQTHRESELRFRFSFAFALNSCGTHLLRKLVTFLCFEGHLINDVPDRAPHYPTVIRLPR
ncbi:hypothetical protein NPIL_13651 [Nephila pilipes]|uniref:Uncharacterized protein n=1 Tax=Nephila pilipes TaxID=299642 RepID=A0A8X6MND0_NEPPI|nr:hypothetical protein NPIL_13651 [Nephila pilipes]